MKRLLIALIAALAAAVSLSGCFFVERDHDDRHRDGYEHHYREYDHDRGYNHYNGF